MSIGLDSELHIYHPCMHEGNVFYFVSVCVCVFKAITSEYYDLKSFVLHIDKSLSHEGNVWRRRSLVHIQGHA